jgi:hypothetical protein
VFDPPALAEAAALASVAPPVVVESLAPPAVLESLAVEVDVDVDVDELLSAVGSVTICFLTQFVPFQELLAGQVKHSPLYMK